MQKVFTQTSALDNWGIGVSLACSIHCAAIPIFLISSSFIGFPTDSWEQLELPMFLIAAIIGSISTLKTYLVLKNKRPVLLLTIGLFLIVLGGAYEHIWFETLLRVAGSIFLILSHVKNKKLLKQ